MESPADVIKDSVQDDADAFFVEICTDPGKVFIRSQTGVDPAVIPGIVSMCVGLKYRRKIDGVRPKSADMGYPVIHFCDPVFRNTVVFKGCTAETERIDLVKYAFISPHKICLLFCEILRRA